MKKRFIIFIVIVLFSGFLVFAVHRFSASSSVQVSPPIWNGVVPGVTTQQEVVAILGKPSNIKRTPFNILYQYEIYSVSNGFGKFAYYNEVFFRYGKVDYIIENLIVDEEKLTPNTLFRLYGEPEKATYANPDMGINALLYCEQGFITTGTFDTILYKIYFYPQSTKACMKRFRFALPGYWKGPEDILVEEDPWGFNEEE
jgi:hypothetical protein